MERFAKNSNLGSIDFLHFFTNRRKSVEKMTHILFVLSVSVLHASFILGALVIRGLLLGYGSLLRNDARCEALTRKSLL